MSAVPVHISAELKRYDPLLRLRWSREINKFVLERKADKRFIPKPVKYVRVTPNKVRERLLPEWTDRYIQYHDGYTPILTATKLDRRLFLYLYYADTKRFGNTSRYLDKVSSFEQKQEETENRKDSELVRDMTGEAYDTLLVKQGERMFMRS